MLNIALPTQAESEVQWSNLFGSSLALAVIEASKKYKDGPIVLIVEDISHASSIRDELSFYKDAETQIHYLPDWETLPYDVFSPHADIISERLKTLSCLPAISNNQILVLPVNTLLQKLPPKSFIQNNVLLLNKGQTLDIDNFRTSLSTCGYMNVSQVMEHGEFTVRGSIIDIFPSGSTSPYRIDLFDNEIESIRNFDPVTQLSTCLVDNIELLPAREFPTDQQSITMFRERYRMSIDGDPLQSIIYKNVSEGNIPAGIEYYLPLFFDNMVNIFDHIPEDSLFIVPDLLNDSVNSYLNSITERYEQRKHDIHRPILNPDRLYIDTSCLNTRLSKTLKVITSKHKSVKSSQNIPVSSLQSFNEKYTDNTLGKFYEYINKYQGRILLVAETTGRQEIILEQLRDNHFYPEKCENWVTFIKRNDLFCITTANIDTGLTLTSPHLCVVTESQIFGQRVSQKRRRKNKTRDAEAIIRNLSDLNIGSPVVHTNYGVGRYLGLQNIQDSEIESEYLLLQYKDNDKLYVPVSSLHLISRYTGASPESAPLHKLGTDQWLRARKRAVEQTRDVAAELLEIYAKRAAITGNAYDINHDEYMSFMSSFPFEETVDQENAINQVMSDLSSPSPMDRVVCGDVGFGKTEVAMRAAFVVANSGKQVAILVPTTLLAQQHYQNFCDRFADWPIKVASLSRFNTKKQQDNILEEMKNGIVDIVIGTHKLLQKDIIFKDLGIIIIDEEHRFGVRHKEKLKSLRSEVDILTLTATPIPRTLNMSLAGIRELSIIASPPINRHAITTFVTQWDDSLITEACQREIKRAGQVYFLHNEVKTIEQQAQKLSALVPDADIRIAHGQLPEKELENVMLDFYHQRFNILVCTTIIESGIDIPTANTIIINKADKLGLAQLHQIRGRVGRSHHRAYAYLITPLPSLMTADAKKRIEAIESLEDLGVGFTLATHDLEIRGAGELLGEDQSGQISEVGFSLYSELLEKAVETLKNNGDINLSDPLNSRIEIDLGIAALIPDDYVHDVHLRLILYKRISGATSNEDLDELRVEFIDRFGLIPETTKNLFKVTELKLLAEEIGLQSIDIHDKGGKLIFLEKPNINPEKLIELIQLNSRDYKFNGTDTLSITHEMQPGDKRVIEIMELLNTLSMDIAA